jgi:hypothetical protein
MVMQEGQIYRCQNPHCLCELKVLRSSVQATANPRCCCGAEMKKAYRKPGFRRLDSELEAFHSGKGRKN